MSKLTADDYLAGYACDDTGKEIFNFFDTHQPEINPKLGTEGDDQLGTEGGDLPLTFLDAENKQEL